VDQLPDFGVRVLGRELYSACQVSQYAFSTTQDDLTNGVRYQGDMSRNEGDKSVRVFMARDKAKVNVLQVWNVGVMTDSLLCF
jgi:hypothetical protein